jgi:hypothetical protein
MSDQTIDMDALFHESVDREASAEVTKDQLLLPAGYYQTDPEANGEFGVSVYTKEDTGRRVISFSGKVINVKTGQVGFIRGRMSPDPVRKEDGKYDFMYQVWVTAENAFKAQFGQNVESKGQIIDYIRQYPVKFKIVQVGVPTERNPQPDGEPGNLVMSISHVR